MSKMKIYKNIGTIQDQNTYSIFLKIVMHESHAMLCTTAKFHKIMKKTKRVM